MFDSAELGVFWLHRCVPRGFSRLPALGWEQSFLCLVLLLEVLLQVYHLSFGFNGRLRGELSLVPAPLYHRSGSCHHYTRPSKQSRAWRRTAPSLAVLRLLACLCRYRAVAQRSSVVEGSRFLYSFPKLEHKFGSRQD